MSELKIEQIFHYYHQFTELYGKDLMMDDELMTRINDARHDESGDDLKKSESKQTKMSNNPNHPLWKYKSEIENCTKCDLCKSRNQFVFGAGNPDADIMFIGEAPGAEEDRTGIPFVGRSGNLLDKLLAGIQFRREDIFIANILKCRPLQNRDPLPSEIAECIPHLHRQIEIIKPKVMICLGRIAAQNLLNSSDNLKSMRERVWEYHGVDMIVTYHPAAILRNSNLMATGEADFQRVAKLVQSKIEKE